MGRMRIAVPLDSGTLSASSARADFPVTNLHHHDPGFCWSPVSLAAEYVALDYGVTPPPVSCIALLYTNLRPSVSVRLRASNVAAINSGDAAPLDVSVPPANGLGAETRDGWTDFVHFLSAPVTYRHWRFDIADAGHPDGLLRLGRLVMDRDFETRHDYESDGVPDDYGQVDDAPDGRVLAGPTLLGKRLEFTVGLLPVADMAPRWRRVLARGRTAPLLVVQDPDAASDRQDKMVYGSFRQRPSVPRRYNEFYAGRFEIRGWRP